MAHPYCHWCDREVREYPGEDHGHHDDRATVDHLNDLNMGRPRPERGSTVLACAQCNNKRSAIMADDTYCCECARPCHGIFCSRECQVINAGRILAHPRPWEAEKARMKLEKRREHKKRQSARKKEENKGKISMKTERKSHPGGITLHLTPGWLIFASGGAGENSRARER